MWKRDTAELFYEFLDSGFKAVIVCVNERYLDASFVGRILDESFLNDLPENVDPCGENGEFHTFVFDGPIFKNTIRFDIGEIVYKKYVPTKQTDNSTYDCNVDKDSTENPFDTGFWYCDLLPHKVSEKNISFVSNASL